MPAIDSTDARGSAVPEPELRANLLRRVLSGPGVVFPASDNRFSFSMPPQAVRKMILQQAGYSAVPPKEIVNP